MAHEIEPQANLMTRHPSWGWLRVFFFGCGLFVITTIVMFVTGNPNLYPTVILIGNFLVPIVFVTFLYDHQHLSTLPAITIIQSFILGGIFGVLGASILEPLIIPASASNQGLTLSGALVVGLIEEGCKAVAVVILARHVQHDREIDGVLLGGAVGMGFAALESTGYAFTIFLASQGAVGASIIETVVRGALAPFGHGVWTAILGAALFRQSGPRHFRLTVFVGLAYLLVALLHGLWDGFPRIRFLMLPLGVRISVASIVINLAGIVILGGLWRQALGRATQQPSVVTPREQ